jgi:hypothetical protein
VETSERWAYRHHEVESLAEVIIESIGSKRPLRTKIRFVDDSFEGRAEWVPPSRLKCLWLERDEFEVREAAWRAVHAPGSGASAVEVSACHWICDVGLGKVLSFVKRQRGGLDTVTKVYDWSAVRSLTGLSTDDFPVSDRVSRDGVDFLPWPAARTIALAYLKRHAPEIISELREDVRAGSRDRDRDLAHFRQWGTPERDYLQDSVNESQSMLALVAEWAGEPAMADVDGILELRARFRSQWAAIRSHTIALIRAGQTEMAWTFWKAVKPEAQKRPWTAVIRLEQALTHEAVMDGRGLSLGDTGRLKEARSELLERVFGEFDPWRPPPTKASRVDDDRVENRHWDRRWKS